MMMTSDPIADMLTRIRNANTAKHDTVDIPASKIKVAIAGILVDEGFIEKYDIVEDGKIKTIHVTLKYGADKNEKVITGIKRISKPGLRVYAGKDELPKVLESVSEDKDGVITVTLTNNSLESSEDVDIILTNEGDKYSVSEARYIEGAMDAHNTFEAPEVVDEKDFTAYENTQTGVKVTLPACSVVTLRLSK